MGTALAHAGLFGIGPDINVLDPCGHGNKKSDSHHPRPGAEVSADTSRTMAATSVEAPQAKVGSQPEAAPQAAALSASPDVSQSNNAAVRSLGSASQNVAVAQSMGGGGGLARPPAVRAGNLPPVSTAPSTRSVVIRGLPSAGGAALAPAFTPSAVAGPVIALAAPPPAVPEPAGRPAPAAPPSPSPSSPPVREQPGSSGSGVARIPASYRAGYAEYLRAADTSDLFIAALPGAAGIAGFTLIGAFAGYRQAKGLQKAVVPPAPTSVLL